MRRKEGAERTIILANDETFGPLQLSTKAIATGKPEGSSQHVADSQGLPLASTPKGQEMRNLQRRCQGWGALLTHRAGILPRCRPE